MPGGKPDGGEGRLEPGCRKSVHHGPESREPLFVRDACGEPRPPIDAPKEVVPFRIEGGPCGTREQDTVRVGLHAGDTHPQQHGVGFGPGRQHPFRVGA